MSKGLVFGRRCSTRQLPRDKANASRASTYSYRATKEGRRATDCAWGGERPRDTQVVEMVGAAAGGPGTMWRSCGVIVMANNQNEGEGNNHQGCSTCAVEEIRSV